jgi:hypothetical protein
MHYWFIEKIWLRLPFTVSLLICSTVSQADSAQLNLAYQARKAELANNDYGIPISIISSNKQHTMRGEVYGIIEHAYPQVKQALLSPSAWCDIVQQHLNIKVCTDARIKSHCQLTIYSGRKFYQKAEDVYQLHYRFSVTHNEPAYFQVLLTAKKGPMGTRNYRIEIEAKPINQQQTFLHFNYTYGYNFMTSLGMKVYLATLGSGKVGFSRTGRDKQGRAVFVHGVRGIIERNTVRYFFAIQSYLDSLAMPAEQRTLARYKFWFDLTERFPRQLHELDKKDYLAYKQREHADQLRLQQQVETPCHKAGPTP